jgi:hypothetical protein
MGDEGMLKTRDRVLKFRWMNVEELTTASYYADLYPLPRDLSGLRRSFERHGFRAEYPIVVRVKATAEVSFEIVCGVGRYTVARECGMRRVPIVVRRFDDDRAVRAYAIEDNLFNTIASSKLSLAHMIVLARALKECGVDCAPRQIWEAAGVSPSTYWRADGSLGKSLKGIIAAHPELQKLDFSRQVAEILRNDFAPQFTYLFAGAVEVNTYHQAQGRDERAIRRIESKAKESGTSRVRGRATKTDPVRSNKQTNEIPIEVKEPGRNKPAKKDSNLSLFDL